jgi:hypothetical protein
MIQLNLLVNSSVQMLYRNDVAKLSLKLSLESVYIQLIFSNFKTSVERQFIIALVANSFAGVRTQSRANTPALVQGQRRPALLQRQSWHAAACHHMPVTRFVDPWPGPARLLHPPCRSPANSATDHSIGRGRGEARAVKASMTRVNTINT